MRTEDTHVWTLFVTEATQSLQDVEQGLLALEHDPSDSGGEVNRLYRALHTVKGNSALLSLKNIESLAHAAEDVMAMVRDGAVSMDQEIADLLLGTVDLLRQAIGAAAQVSQDVAPELVAPKVEQVRQWLSEHGHVQVAKAVSDGGVHFFSEPASAPSAGVTTPSAASASSQGGDVTVLDPDSLGMLLSLARNLMFPQGALLSSPAQLREATSVLRGAAERLAVGPLLAALEALAGAAADELPVTHELCAPLGRELAALERVVLAAQPGAAGYGFMERFEAGPQRLVVKPAALAAARAAVAQVIRETPKAAKAAPAKAPAAARDDASRSEFLRIDARKVSLVMDLAGEIGLACSAVTHHPELEGRELEGFAAAAHKLEMLVRELQNEVSALRLVPIATVFQPMRRVVRDAAQRTGKQVELVINGEETEIDKVMVDALHDPLVHLLRNAIDHGIETPAARRAAGKPETGKVILEAAHQGGEVCVRVSDDGRGLDREKIRERALARGLLTAGNTIPDEQLLDLVFLPGFSTKEQIDELSGRGVGMDVIKTTIEGLRGRVHLQSTAGKGSSVVLTVPLTMAFLDAMVVKDAGYLYALPIEKVREVFKTAEQQVCTSAADGRVMLRVRERLVPVLRLGQFYGGPPVNPDTLAGMVVVVVQSANGPLGLPVDALLGNQPVMLKPLRGVISNVRAAAGCGMLRSGDVALTLDCERLHA